MSLSKDYKNRLLFIKINFIVLAILLTGFGFIIISTYYKTLVAMGVKSNSLLAIIAVIIDAIVVKNYSLLNPVFPSKFFNIEKKNCIVIHKITSLLAFLITIFVAGNFITLYV